MTAERGVRPHEVMNRLLRGQSSTEQPEQDDAGAEQERPESGAEWLRNITRMPPPPDDAA